MGRPEGVGKGGGVELGMGKYHNSEPALAFIDKIDEPHRQGRKRYVLRKAQQNG
ncbi:MAG: hypothetical protein RI910_1175 [Verrucomicrobiota bacterium]|jgi:hypothetical protein